jgi:chemotaxis protein methyltransferase CheR
MHDRDCIAFLQCALPHLRLRWAGFRKVRHQVCKRIDRRCRELELPDVVAYRYYLTAQPAEWPILASLCRISISRFYRDRAVFDQVAQVVLPALAKSALARNATELRCWSLGCASGEEPYSLNLMWQLVLASSYPGLTCRIIPTNADEHLLQRGRVGCYPASSPRELPPQWPETAFIQRGAEYCL